MSTQSDPKLKAISIKDVENILETNKTITPLGIDETFTTEWFDSEGYSNLNVLINTDVNGSVFIDYSIDGVVLDYSKETLISIEELNGFLTSASVLSSFMRVRYTNGATPQTTFRMSYTFTDKPISDLSINSGAGGIDSPDGFIDEGNSTSTLLGADELFTGEWIETTLYSSMTVYVKPDEPGQLQIEFSSDGITTEKTKRVSETAPRGSNHTLAIISKYMRISYLNGDVANTSFFVIQCILHKYKSKNLTTTSDRSIGPGTDVQMSRIANNVEVDIALGRVSDQSTNFLFGTNPNVSTTPEDVWGLGGTYNWLSAPSTIEVDSNDIDDDFTGLGAQLVVIIGLDANWDEQIEVVALVGNGTSASTTNTFIRVNRAVVVQAGTLRGANFDDLQVRASGGGVILALITGLGANNSDYGFGISQLGLFSIPRNKDFLVEDITLNVSGGKVVTINAFGLTNPNTLGSAKTLLFTLNEFEGVFRAGKNTYDRVAPMTDIWFSAFTSTGNSAIDIRLYYKLVDTPLF